MGIECKLLSTLPFWVLFWFNNLVQSKNAKACTNIKVACCWHFASIFLKVDMPEMTLGLLNVILLNVIPSSVILLNIILPSIISQSVILLKNI